MGCLLKRNFIYYVRLPSLLQRTTAILTSTNTNLNINMAENNWVDSMLEMVDPFLTDNDAPTLPRGSLSPTARDSYMKKTFGYEDEPMPEPGNDDDEDDNAVPRYEM